MSGMRRSHVSASMLIALALSTGISLPDLCGDENGVKAFSSEDKEALKRMDRASADIWLRRLRRGLSPSERKYFDETFKEVL